MEMMGGFRVCGRVQCHAGMFKAGIQLLVA